MSGAGGRHLVTFLSDFGLRDSYVAEVKGVILGLAPTVHLVDVSHDVPAHDLMAGAYLLARVVAAFPPATVHLAVVDPGVGGGRRALAVDTGREILVGPDGLLGLALQGRPPRRTIALPDTVAGARVSPTFHGRDVFGPAVGRLAHGESLTRLGRVTDPPAAFPARGPLVGRGGVRGRVIHVDRFGNLITDIGRAMAAQARGGASPGVRMTVGLCGRRIRGLVRTYSDAPRGTLVALWGSADLLEIAVVEGDARQRLGARRGTPVAIQERSG